MKRTFVCCIIIFVAVVFVVFIAKFMREAFFVFGDTSRQSVSIVISEGVSVRRIARELRDHDIIKSPFLFELYVRMRGLSSSLPAGVFSLASNSSFHDAVTSLLEATAAGVQVTIPEGHTLRKIWEKLYESFPKMTEADFFEAVGRASPLKKTIPFLANLSSEQNLEGYVFPDTYFFAPNSSAETIVRIMVETLQRRLFELGIQKSGNDLHEFLTLASIIEREVQKPEDMANIADIFFRRLKIGMALQSDATLNYAIGGSSPSLSARDLENRSPYNTYLYPGLPPGPICNPGMNALLAVLRPTKNPWMYFLTTPSGDVKYARTFDEHVMNKNRYLR